MDAALTTGVLGVREQTGGAGGDDMGDGYSLWLAVLPGELVHVPVVPA